jgi:outer membrane protein assembly factor BamB
MRRIWHHYATLQFARKENKHEMKPEPLRFVIALLFAACFVTGCRKASQEAPTPADDIIEVPAPRGVTISATSPIDDLPLASPAPGDWPWWRGPTHDHIAESGQNPPTGWSETSNVLWKADLPGGGHATPCLVGRRIFVPTADKEQQAVRMHCLERDTGKQVWETVLWNGPLRKIHKDNSYAAATPTCDGERVYYSYQTSNDVRVAALTLDGDRVWDQVVTPYKSIQGFSASPFLYKSAVILVVDGTDHNQLTALHRKTGGIIWAAAVPGEHESYASAVVGRSAGRDQLVLVGPADIMSYDPNTGTPLWTCEGPAKCYVAVASFDDRRVYATGGYPKRALYAIDANGSGDVTETHLAWKSDRRAGYVPSLLLHNGLIYAVNDEGLMRCYNADSGDIVWEQDLDTKFYSSPVLVGDRIYLFDRTGRAFVMRAGPAFELLAESSLPHGAFASPAICDGRIYIRTHDALYCLGAGGT